MRHERANSIVFPCAGTEDWMGAAVNVVTHIQSPDLTQSLMLSIRLRWPDAKTSSVDTEERLLAAASGADVVLVDQLVAPCRRAGRRYAEFREAALRVG